jgi:hypothetical protein
VKHNAGACSKLLQSFSPLAALPAAQTIIVPVPVDKSILCFPGGAWFSGQGLVFRVRGLAHALGRSCRNSRRQYSPICRMERQDRNPAKPKIFDEISAV